MSTTPNNIGNTATIPRHDAIAPPTFLISTATTENSTDIENANTACVIISLKKPNAISAEKGSNLKSKPPIRNPLIMNTVTDIAMPAADAIVFEI